MNEIRATQRSSTNTAPRVLVVEDEAALSLLLSYNLEAEGFIVERIERGDEAELKLEETPPDLVILDWMLPGVSGLEVCRRLRARDATRTLPVIMLTARGEEAERVRGLAVGADDYVVKPFSIPELMARVKALLRRAKPERIAAQLVAGDLELDRETRRLRRAGRNSFGSDGVPFARASDGEAGARLFARPASRQRLGHVGGNRRTHRRRSRRALTQSARARSREGPYPHRARRRLFAR